MNNIEAEILSTIDAAEKARYSELVNETIYEFTLQGKSTAKLRRTILPDYYVKQLEGIGIQTIIGDGYTILDWSNIRH